MSLPARGDRRKGEERKEKRNQGGPYLIGSNNALLGLVALVLYAQVVRKAAVAVEAPLLVGQQRHRLVELYLRFQCSPGKREAVKDRYDTAFLHQRCYQSRSLQIKKRD